MRSNSKYVIQFSGLSLGKHEFDWELEPTFFDEESLDDILEASLVVRLALTKAERMMSLDFHFSGKAKCVCDRCGEDFWMSLDSENELIARFASETNLYGDEVIFLGPAEYQLDLRQYIYEFTLLDLPVKKTHESGGCNSKVLEYLSDKEEEKIEIKEKDPRWKALEKLKKDA